MPSVITHAAVGLACARVFSARPMPASYWLLSGGLAMLPDLDVLAFSFGIPYGARFGHRGFSHSLFCAALVGLAVGYLGGSAFGRPWWVMAIYFFGVMASHGILDLFTNGGMGIAILSPFDDTRYFAPWRPVQVCTIGLNFFNPWNLRAFRSELAWIWLPLAAVVGGVLWYRAKGG
jgi:inner membrane protein